MQLREGNWLLYCVPRTTGASILGKQVREWPGEPCMEDWVSCSGQEGVRAGFWVGQDLQEVEKKRNVEKEIVNTAKRRTQAFS